MLFGETTLCKVRKELINHYLSMNRCINPYTTVFYENDRFYDYMIYEDLYNDLEIDEDFTIQYQFIEPTRLNINIFLTEKGYTLILLRRTLGWS